MPAATAPLPAESAALLFSPAPRRLLADGSDPYDWPTEEQLYEFVARRQVSRTELT